MQLRFNNVFTAFFLIVILCAIIFSAMNAVNADVEHSNNLSGINIPSGMFFSVVLNQPVDTTIIRKDDTVQAFFTSDMYLYERLLIPKGSMVLGRVMILENAHQGRDARIMIRFVSLILKDKANTQIPIDATIMDKNSDGSIGGQLSERSKLRKVVHYLEEIGGIVQVMPTGDRIMGKELYIPAGERFIIQLMAPANFPVTR